MGMGPSRLLTVLRRGGGGKWVTAPEMLRAAPDVLIDGFEDKGDWVAGSASSADDVVEKTQGLQSVEWTPNENVNATLRKDSLSVDMSTCSVLAADILRKSAYKAANQRLYLFPLSGGDFVINTLTKMYGPIQNDWYTAVFTRDVMTAESGASSWSNIEEVRFQSKTATGESTVASFDNLRMVFSKPFVLIQFDDQEASIYNYAFPVMQRLGILGTFYVITDNIGGSFVTEAMLQEMYAAGWDIGIHGDTNLTTLTQEQTETAIQAEETALNGMGFTRASKHMAYPFGDYNADTVAAMSATGMLTGRGGNTLGSVEDSTVTLPSTLAYQIPYWSMDSSSLADAKAGIDRFAETGGGQCMVWHSINEDNWSAADFETLMKYIIQKKVQPITITQLYSLLSGDTLVYQPW
jgi:peptidoglycan/xylan/chitin deacetylase (PgdA/CDA1 family)